MSLQRSTSSPPRSPRHNLYVSPTPPPSPRSDVQSSPPPHGSLRRLRDRMRRRAPTHTLIVYVRPTDALVAAAPHMLLVPDDAIDSEVRQALALGHRASTNSLIGDDTGHHERFRRRAAALCDARAFSRAFALPHDPSDATQLPRHAGVFEQYRLLAPPPDVTASRLTHVYFVHGVLGI